MLVEESGRRRLETSSGDDYLIYMSSLYIPYNGIEPAPVFINGHRFLILSRDPLVLEDRLELLGADSVHEVQCDDFQSDAVLLDSLAERIEGGVVIAPGDVDVAQLILDLESELPWLQ